ARSAHRASSPNAREDCASASSPLHGGEPLLPHEELIAAQLPRALKERPRRRPARYRAVLVIDAAMTGTEEELRLGLPVHRATQVRAVDVEDLEHLGPALLPAPDPERGVRGLAGPGQRARVADLDEPRLAEWELAHVPDRDRHVRRLLKERREQVADD